MVVGINKIGSLRRAICNSKLETRNFETDCPLAGLDLPMFTKLIIITMQLVRYGLDHLHYGLNLFPISIGPQPTIYIYDSMKKVKQCQLLSCW